jgi:hypothetical protein
VFERLGCWAEGYAHLRSCVGTQSSIRALRLRWDVEWVLHIGTGIGLGGGSEDSGKRPREIDVHPSWRMRHER